MKVLQDLKKKFHDLTKSFKIIHANYSKEMNIIYLRRRKKKKEKEI